MRIELTGNDTASCGDYSAISRVSPIGKLARKMIDEGARDDAVVSVYRDGLECFKPVPLSVWADLTTIENDTTNIRHAKYRPFQAHGSLTTEPE